MTRAQVDATNQAVFAVQAIALILRALGDGETPVDPGAIDWLGQRLEEAHEAIEVTVRATRAGAGA